MARQTPSLGIILGLVLSAAWAIPVHGAWAPDGVQVSTAVSDQRGPSIASDGRSGAFIAWHDQRFGVLDIFAQWMDSTGVAQWTTNGVPVCDAPGHQAWPSIVPDPNLGVVVFWEDQRTGSSDVYAQRLSNRGAPLWNPLGVPLCTRPGVQGHPMAIGDGSSGVVQTPGYIAVWTDAPNVNQLDRVRIRAQHVDLAGGALWTSPDSGGVIVDGSVSSKFGVAIVTDGVGTIHQPKGAVVTWTDPLQAGGITRVYARRVNSGGLPLWGGPVPVGGAAGYEKGGAIANVGGDRVVVAWSHLPDLTSEEDIYAQMLDQAGTLLWSIEAKPVCRATGTQTNPTVAADGLGGCVVAWTDYRNGTKRIYAQRLDASGSPRWTPDGIPLSPGDTPYGDPKIIPDNAGGAIVVWEDARNLTADLYAQRVGVNGVTLWTPGGAPLTRAGGYQTMESIVSDNAFGVIATWEDNRSGVYDIYANRIRAAEAVVGVESRAPGTLRVALASRNPTAGPARVTLQLPEAVAVTVEVLDLAGRRVRQVLSDEWMVAGPHAVGWDVADAAGESVAPGIYLVRLRAGAREAIARIVVVR